MVRKPGVRKAGAGRVEGTGGRWCGRASARDATRTGAGPGGGLDRERTEGEVERSVRPGGGRRQPDRERRLRRADERQPQIDRREVERDRIDGGRCGRY